MITSYEVGAVLKIIDQVSPALSSLAKLAKDLDKAIIDAQKSLSGLASTKFAGLISQIGDVGKALGDSGLAGDTATKAIVAGFGRVDTAIATTAAGIKSLQTSITQLGAAQGVLGGHGGGRGAPPGIRGRAGSGPHGWGHFGRTGVDPHGITAPHFSMTTTPMLAGAAALGYGVFLEGAAEDQLARMILTGQMNSDVPMVGTPQFDQARQTLQRISSSTGIGVHEVGEAMLGVERQFGGLPFDKRIAVEETIAPYAASESKLKETNFKEAFEAMVGLSHMTGTYDPAKLPELMRQFSYASLITPAGIPQFRNAISYSMPILHSALDMDPSSVMFLTAMMQTAGITNTKSGTWLRSFFERSYAPLGDAPADLKKLTALQALGMVDKDRKAIWESRGPDGKVNWDQSIVKLTEIISKYMATHTTEERLQALRDAFGERGGGFGALMNLPEFIAQFPILQAKMRQFKGGTDVLSYLNENSPTQQYNKAVADTQIALMDLGKTVLPSVVEFLKEFDTEIRNDSAAVKAFAAAIQPAIDALHGLASGISGAVSGVVSGIRGVLSGGSSQGGAPNFVRPGVPTGGVPARNPWDKPMTFGMLSPPSAAASPGSNQPIHVKSAVYLDGRVIGESMSSEMARLSTFPRQAPYSDPYASWAAPDYNFQTG